MRNLWNAVTKATTKQRRKMLANEIFLRHSGIVQRGAYKGLVLDGNSNVSRGELGLKILGLYEPPVVAAIRAAAPFRDLIVFGAADGYMSLGPLMAGYCQRSICFEITEKGQRAVAANAALNALSDRVIIRGRADASVARQLSEINAEPPDMLVLCDIEGAEFDLLTAPLLQALRGATLIVELHDGRLVGNTTAREALLARLPDGAQTSIMHADTQEFSGIEDLESMHDLDRALVMSEWRKSYGEWLLVQYQ